VADEFLTVVVLPCAQPEVLVLRVVGEVDLFTVGHLRKQLDQQVCPAHRAVVLDCTGVSFLAACGIGVLVEFAAQARARGLLLRLVTTGQMVRRALEATQVDGLLPRVTTVAEAIAQCAIRPG
jgi:anti-anti-sigma factor